MALIDNLASYWKLDEAAGAVIDSHGANNGTNVGATPNVAGKINTAYDFVAAESDYITVPDAANLRSVGNPISVSIWVKKDDYDIVEFLTKELDWLIETRADNRFQGTLWGLATGPSNVQYVTGTWYHLVFTYDGVSTVKLYMNNVLVASNTGAESSSGTNPLEIGRRPADYWDGILDEIGIWNRELTGVGGEVTELWNNGNALAYPFVVGTNMKINIGDVFKDIESLKINIGDAWKNVIKVQQNIGDVWKDVFG